MRPLLYNTCNYTKFTKTDYNTTQQFSGQLKTVPTTIKLNPLTSVKTVPTSYNLYILSQN